MPTAGAALGVGNVTVDRGGNGNVVGATVEAAATVVGFAVGTAAPPTTTPPPPLTGAALPRRGDEASNELRVLIDVGLLGVGKVLLSVAGAITGGTTTALNAGTAPFGVDTALGGAAAVTVTVGATTAAVAAGAIASVFILMACVGGATTGVATGNAAVVEVVAAVDGSAAGNLNSNRGHVVLWSPAKLFGSGMAHRQ